MAILTTMAAERGTYVVTASFKDENGQPTVPINIHWRLSDQNGAVQNNRSDEQLTPASTVNIVMSGDDLAVVGMEPTVRVLTLWGAYNSLYGNNMPFTSEVRFIVENLIGVI